MENREIRALSEELDASHKKITTCLRGIHSLDLASEEQVCHAVDLFVDKIQRELHDTLYEHQTEIRDWMPEFQLDEMDQEDLRCLDTVSPRLLTTNHGPQHSPSTSGAYDRQVVSTRWSSPCSSNDTFRCYDQRQVEDTSVTSATSATSAEVRRTAQQDNLDALTHVKACKSTKSGRAVAEANGSSGQLDSKMLSLMGHDLELVAGHVVFEDFSKAIRYICANKILKMPPSSCEALTIVAFLGRIHDADFAHVLYRRLALWRLNRSYQQLCEQFAQTRSQLKTSERRQARAGRASSQAMEMLIMAPRTARLVRENQHPKDFNQLKTQTQNYLRDSNPWSSLCERVSPGILCLIPRVPPSWFERLRADTINDFLQALKQKRGEQLWSLAATLSPHLEAILEGQECLLKTMVAECALRDWNHVLASRDHLSQCVHMFSLPGQ